MANINQLASILSGDKIGEAKQRFGKASANVAQHKHQKEIIEELNRLIEQAQKKSKKNKFGFGLGGSLLGGLLGTVLTGMTGGVAAPIMAALGAGVGSYGMEEIRQNKLGVTDELDAYKTKMGGRKQGKLAETASTSIDDAMDEAHKNAAMMDAILAFAMPGSKETTGTGTSAVTTGKGPWGSLGQKPWKKGWAAKAPGDAIQDMIDIPGIPEWVNKAIKGGGELMSHPATVGLTRSLLPTLIDSGFKVEDYQTAEGYEPYSTPQFRNPYSNLQGY